MKVVWILLSLYQEIIDKWDLDKVEKIIDAVESEIEREVNGGNFKDEEDFLNICLNVFGRAIVSMKEILHLLAAGYPDGATCIARNVYENMIVLSYLESNVGEANFHEIIEKYYKDMSVVRHRTLKLYYESLGIEEKIDEHTHELEKIKTKYGVKKFTDYWWCSENSFKDIVTKVFDFHDESLKDNSLTPFLILLYKKACITLHATCTGNVATIGRHSETNIIETSPTINDFHIPLFLSLMSFHVIMLICFAQLNIDTEPFSKQIVIFANENLKKFSSQDYIDS